MISTRTLACVVACCAGSLAMSLAAFAAGTDAVTPGGPADQRVFAGWMQVVDSASAVTLRHRVDIRRPVHFKSRKPCAYWLSTVFGEDRLEGSGPARCAQLLGLSERHPDTSSCFVPYRTSSNRPLGTRGDTLVSQTLELAFQRPGREVTFVVDGTQEMARITDTSNLWACLPLPQRIPGLVALARISFPWDSLLTLIEPGQPAAADSGSPSLGDYVYIEELPEAIEKEAPKYPNDAQQAGAEGTVQVRALIGKDGEVRQTAIVESIPLLDRAAVQAVEQWRFRPAMSNGKPVPVWVAVPVKFTLED